MKSLVRFLVSSKTKHNYNQIVKSFFLKHPKQVLYQAEPHVDFSYLLDITSSFIGKSILNLWSIPAHVCSKMQAKEGESRTKFSTMLFQPLSRPIIHFITTQIKNKTNQHVFCGGNYYYGKDSHGET